MTRICFQQPDGSTTTVDASDGESVMKAATGNLVPGIVADCGGELSCATCHVYVTEEWQPVVGEAAGFEDEMLDATSEDRAAGSRLSCQIVVAPRLEGMTVGIPRSQW